MFLRYALTLSGLALATLATAQCAYTEVNFTTSTALYPWETGWQLYHLGDTDTTQIVSFQGSIEGTFSQQTCLEDGCYYFLATDSWGDGWNGTTLSADVDLAGFDGEFTLENGFFGYLPFTVGEAACDFQLGGCTNPDAINFVEGATYDDGSCTEIQSFTYTDGGANFTRSYIYYTPANMQPGAPLVFALHGYSGDALGMFTFGGFREVADAEGFGLIIPQGSPDGSGTNHWNANFNFTNVNDHAFLTQLAQYIQETHGHDPACTYSCGYSNGGYMSYSLACAHADVFRGIGSVGGQIGGNDWATCDPSQPVPVVHLHGTADNVVAYAGNPNDAGNWGGNPSVETLVATWASWNNCTEVSEEALPNINMDDNSTVDLITHSGGDGGYEARVYRVNNGGHDWFGSWGNMDITSAVEMWDFWSQFCGSTSAIVSPEAMQSELVRWNGAQFTAIEACRVRVFEASGKAVFDRPMRAGESVAFSGCGQVYLMSAHQHGGDFQQLKFWAQ
jgi:polyhydroxybutyrate depolymerase